MDRRLQKLLGFPVAVALCFTASGTLAQETIYIGIGFGQLDYNQNTGDPLLGVIDDTIDSYKLFGGFEFNENFGIEILYGATDDLVTTVSGNIPPFGDLTDTAIIEIKTSALRAIGQLPLDWGVLIGGLGYFSSDRDFDETLVGECCGTLRNTGSVNDDGLTAMLGVEWRFGRFGTTTGIRLEYEWWDTSRVDLSTLGVALSYRF